MLGECLVRCDNITIGISAIWFLPYFPGRP